jgi:hypothetical protein
MADRGQEPGAAWLPHVKAAPVLAMLKATHVSSLPSCSLTLFPSLWSRPSSSSTRRSATESSTAHIPATTTPFPNLFGQNLWHDLLYTLQRLAKPAGSQVERKGSFFFPAMPRAPLTFRSTVARAMLCFTLLHVECFALLESGRNCRSCQFSHYRASLTGTSHHTRRVCHGHRRVKLRVATLVGSTVDWSRVPCVLVVDLAVRKMLLGEIDPMAWNANASEVGVATVPPCMVARPCWCFG